MTGSHPLPQGFYDTMDVGHIDPDGFVHVMGRADDVINVSGHRLSTSELEEACYTDANIIDCAVIAIPHEVKGQLISTYNKNTLDITDNGPNHVCQLSNQKIKKIV